MKVAESTIGRRQFLRLAAGLLVSPRLVAAQEPTRPRRVGYLSASTPDGVRPLIDVFRMRLRELGWQEPRLAIDLRFAEGRLERLPELAADLVKVPVDLIYAPSTSASLAVQKATHTIPVVMLTSEPLATRLVGSLARPTGNMTGLTNSATEVAGKQIQFLQEIVPGVSRMAVLSNPANAVASSAWMQNAEAAARALGIRLAPFKIMGPQEIDRGLSALASGHPGALLVGPDPLFIGERMRIVQFVAEQKIPAMYGFREATDIGGLISYSASLTELTRRAAGYVDQILRGAKPADLPVEQPRTFELVINLKTAKALGLTIPPSMLTRADQIIE